MYNTILYVMSNTIKGSGSLLRGKVGSILCLIILPGV